jgi:hypothetical protein
VDYEQHLLDLPILKSAAPPRDSDYRPPTLEERIRDLRQEDLDQLQRMLDEVRLAR